MKTTLILATNAGAYCYPWANSSTIRVMPPEPGLEVARHFDKVILINGVPQRYLWNPALEAMESYFFLWDPARCPFYAPSRAEIEQLKMIHKVYSFQKEDCGELGLCFNSTMYAPPPPGLLPENPEIECDLLFLGVPKDRLPLLRALHGKVQSTGLRACFRIGLTGREPEDVLPEKKDGWEITRAWMRYPDYLRLAMRSRAILDIYQTIQTGYSLRVMEHIFFGKKLVTNNAVIRFSEFYHPNNIFLLQQDDLDSLKDWLDLPFVPIKDEIKEYYRFENWVERFV
ncbi:MAG: hypothetical protein FWE98_01100 [Oscillospiraceae bacterium]|nr:hypothetical protein [Oscillospiraceae bacterium]